ncbi:MAG: glycoside hydrolase family 88 protein [Spirochaetales bacterium]|nr:glycoside hydrolase family 88 protein [Spirochaetales bacterium]
MIDISSVPSVDDIAARLPAVWEAGLRATRLVRDRWNAERGAPVYTEAGAYTTRGWTEWTQGFQFGNALYLHEATGEPDMLEYGRNGTTRYMAPHLTHIGVHDHGFNNVSTYGNILRMMHDGVIPFDEWEARFYRLALKVSGAVQAARWTETADGLGFVHSFNGPHSLFSDTIRSMRAVALAHQLGHALMGEQDRRISLLERLLLHAEATARYNVYYGTGRDSYDVRGRTVHESIFNTKNGVYRSPSTQQGYSPFSTWTRGLAWIAAGYGEQLEWLRELPENAFDELSDTAALLNASMSEREPSDVRHAIEARWLGTACAVADFWLAHTPTDGIAYWDTGAPGLVNMADHSEGPADPYNGYEPVDSSASAITAQGLLRVGRYLDDEAPRLSRREFDLDGTGPKRHTETAIRERGRRYRAAALVTSYTLCAEPYLSTAAGHQGVLLHAIYHRPNGWDFVRDGQRIPNGESCMWGDYHLLELATMVYREATGKLPLRFFDIGSEDVS